MSEEEKAAVENGWKIHTTLIQWTSNVETKATFISALETLVLGGIIALTDDGRRLHGLRDEALTVMWAGMVGLAVAIMIVLWAVKPQLRWWHLQKEAEGNFIYFGHLRLRSDDDVKKHLERAGDMLPALSRQLVVMSDIVWKKHRRLQVSIWLALVSVGLVTIAAALNG